jgi:hypothetical protein
MSDNQRLLHNLSLTPSKFLTNKAPITTPQSNWRSHSVRAMTESNRLRGERLQIMLDVEELAAVDDFRFQKRMPSRASAVRELLRRGLAAEGFLTAPAGSKSSEYGVTGETPE